MNRRPNRYNAARDAYDASIRCPPRRTRYTGPTYTLPVARVLKWMAWAVVAAVAYSFVAPFVATFIQGII